MICRSVDEAMQLEDELVEISLEESDEQLDE